MSFAVEEEKYYPPSQRQVQYHLNVNLVVTANQFEVDEAYNESLKEYFSVESLQGFRFNCLKRLLRINCLSGKGGQCAPKAFSIFRVSKVVDKRRRLYLLLKTIKSCGFNASQVLGGLSPNDRVQVFCVILGMSLFQQSCNVFSHQIQQCFVASESQEAKTIINQHYNKHNTNLSLIITNFRSSEIKTQHFKLFVIDVLLGVLLDKKEEIVSQLGKVLASLSSYNPKGDILYLFLTIQALSPVYIQALKSHLTTLEGVGKCLEFNRLYRSLMNSRKYHQLVNLYEIVLKEWMNESNNLIRLFDEALGSHARHEFVREFLQYLQDFREAEDLLVKKYYRNFDLHLQSQKQFVTQVQVILGKNYTMLVQQLMKQLSPLDTMDVSGVNVNVKMSNVCLYPKEWKIQTLTQVMKEAALASILGNHKVTSHILSRLVQWEQLSNSKDSTRHRDIVHHDITILVDNKIRLTVSLQQLIVILQLLTQSKQLVFLDQVDVPSLQKAVKCGQTGQKTSRSYYKSQNKGYKTNHEVQPPPAYVLEGKIIKVMKRNKVLDFGGILGSLDVEQHLLRVMLDNLIKKQFIEFEDGKYSYLP